MTGKISSNKVTISTNNGTYLKNILDAENQCVPRKLTYVNGKLSKKCSVPLDKKTLAKIKKKNKLWGRVNKQLAEDEEKIIYIRLRN